MSILSNLFGKKPKREQECKILSDDRRCVDELLVVEKGYMEAAETSEAWFLIPHWLIRMEETGKYVQLLTERNSIPIPLGLIFGNDKQEDIEKLTDLKPIARQKYREEKADIERKAGKNKWIASFITITAAAMATVVLLMVVIMLFQSGKLSLPWVGG